MADDAAVRGWIRSALIKYQKKKGSQARLRNAWLLLQGKRQEKEFQNDLNLACAEHYMFARFSSSIGGTQQVVNAVAGAGMAISIPGYAAVKGIAGLFGKSDSLKSDSGPVTKPSADQIYWGYRGVFDAQTDPLVLILPSP